MARKPTVSGIESRPTSNEVKRNVMLAVPAFLAGEESTIAPRIFAPAGSTSPLGSGTSCIRRPSIAWSLAEPLVERVCSRLMGRAVPTGILYESPTAGTWAFAERVLPARKAAMAARRAETRMEHLPIEWQRRLSIPRYLQLLHTFRA